MLKSVVNPNARARPVAIAKARRRPPVVTPEAMTAGSTGRMHGETIVSSPARNPTASSSGLAISASGYGLAVADLDDKYATFLDLHAGPEPLLIPNPWDAGSARILAGIGFRALATTSSGFAATLGKLDGSISREQALAHAQNIAAATDLPVSADLENCFADDPDGVAETVSLASSTGLAGCSIEDFTRDTEEPIYELALAAERVAA